MKKFMENIYLIKFSICLGAGISCSFTESKSTVMWFGFAFLYAIFHLDGQINKK